MNIKSLCRRVGMSPQNFHKKRKVREKKKVDEQLVTKLVQRERALQHRLGGLKLHSMLREELKSQGVSLGRDRFFAVLKRQDLLLERLPKSPRTTNSRHNLPIFRNLVKDLEMTGPNQVWISDITYLRIGGDFAYLSLVTDKYSRKVVGYCLGRTLEAQDTLKALKMALGGLPEGSKPIHHSDRGCQYCSHEYVKELKKHGLLVSMTEVDHCAENAQAERMNGILKQEYFLSCVFRSLAHARKAVDEAVYLYNTRRPHRSLNLKVPALVHGLEKCMDHLGCGEHFGRL